MIRNYKIQPRNRPNDLLANILTVIFTTLIISMLILLMFEAWDKECSLDEKQQKEYQEWIDTQKEMNYATEN